MNSDATHNANGATIDATHTTTNQQSNATLWLSVAQAAEAEGVSVRAVQRRCQSGRYRSRRAQTPQGERLEVDAATLTSRATQGRHLHDDEGSTPATQRRDGRDDEPKRRDAHDTKPSDEGAAVPDRRADEEAARLRAEVERERQEREHDREEIRFLRAMVESLTQSEAQTKAALREALKAMPRQLEQGNAAPETAQERPQIAEPPKTATQPSEAVKSPQNAKSAAPTKEPRPLWKLILGLR